MSGESTVNHQKQDSLSTTNPFASNVSTKEERWMCTFTSTNQSTAHPLLSISMYFVLYPFISIRNTCNFGRSIHQSHFNTRTSHHEYTVLVYIKLLSSIIQSKGFTITSKHSKHHLGEVRKVYSSFLEGEGLLEIETVITSAKHSDPTSSRSRAFRSISSFNRYHSHSQSSIHDTHRNKQRTPSPFPPPASSTHHNLHITGRRSTHLAQRTPRTEHNSCSQYTTNATPHSHAQ